MSASLKMQTLRLIQSNSPCTIADLRDLSDWPERQPSNVLYILKSEGLIEKTDDGYLVTDKGIAEINATPALTRPAPPIDERPDVEKPEEPPRLQPKMPTVLPPPSVVKRNQPKPAPEPAVQASVPATPAVVKKQAINPAGRIVSAQREAEYNTLDALIETLNSSLAAQLQRVKERLMKYDQVGV